MTDQDGLAAISAALITSEAFESVLCGLSPPELQTAGQDLPRAWIRPFEWTEASESDPETILRTVTYSLELAVQSDGENDPTVSLDQLATVVSNALAGQPLCGESLPAYSVLARGKYSNLPAAFPVHFLTLTGTFAYLISGYCGRAPIEAD
jgi:hypothetical protein